MIHRAGAIDFPRHRGFLFTFVLLVTTLFVAALAALPSDASVSDFEKFDLESVSASLSTTQAGAHPDVSTEFTLNGDPALEDGNGFHFPWGNVRNVAVELPPGLTGNPKAFPTCESSVFVNSFAGLSDPSVEQCPTDSQVGLVKPGLFNFFPPGVLPEPLFNLQAPGGDVVARFGFFALFYPIFIDVKADPQRDDALTATVVNVPTTAASVVGSIVTIWGVPTDPVHDTERLSPVEAFTCFAACEPHKSGLAQTAFMSNPTSCGANEIGFFANNYPLPSRIVSQFAPLSDITGCGAVPFEPLMTLHPTTQRSSSPTGIDVNLTVPQKNFGDPKGIRSADLKSAKVTLPEGVSLNTSAADGLEGCSEAQVGVTSVNPVRFDAQDASCPNGSKVGTVKIITPALEDPLEGSLFLARQRENPFGSLLAGYLVAKGKGIVIKQAGRFNLNPHTGQITTVFENAPQQPFSDLELHLNAGARGVLQTPSRCGTYATSYELTPWSGGPPVIGSSAFKISGGCTSGEFNPQLDAGATNPAAGNYSPFVFNLSREDGEQNIGALDLTLPKGETAKLKGVGLCPDADTISGDCPPATRIGTVNVAVGVGSLPLWVPQPGKSPTAVYLAGPYAGAPYSVVAKVPAQAGPFDLGVVAVRSGVYVNPETAQVTVGSDPLPQILQGIPVSYRDIHVGINRPAFTLNPTNCERKTVTSSVRSSQGKSASPSDLYQVGGCGELGFKPKLSLGLKGGTRRGAHPRLRAVLKMENSEANIAKVQVSLPPSEFIENAHFNTVCTRVQFAANQCPSGSVYGHARAITPLLDKPLEGPVYLRSSSHQLPDLVADLRGQIHVVLDGRVDSVNGGLRSTFKAVPDAPVTKFVLEMQGGKKGLFVNSVNLCAKANRAVVRFDGQNGKLADFSLAVKRDCDGRSRR